MSIATSPTRTSYPLSTKKIVKKTVAATTAWVILFGFICVPLMIAVSGNNDLAPYGFMVGFGLFVLLALIVVLTYLYEQWYFNVYYYDLGADYIVIKKGPITPREITIPYERVQDVYVDQDLLDRIFGIFDVHLSSATATSGMEAHIDGVEKSAADGLRATLLATVSARISRSRVSTVTPMPPQA